MIQNVRCSVTRRLRRLLLTLLCLTSLPAAWGISFLWDKLYFNIISSANHTAEVISWTGKYSGSISIPYYAGYNGESYTVIAIGDKAFYDCTGLTSVTIPNSVTTIGEWAFGYCSNLTNISIGNGVTSIGRLAFYECTGLTSITIPNSVTTIEEGAFDECKVTSITIPNSVTSLGDQVFNSRVIEKFVVDSENPAYDSRDNCNAIIRIADNTLVYGCKNTTIPGSVTAIGRYAFAKCSGLTSITIPNGVTTIKYRAFYECTGLTGSITIPNSVTTIEDGAFSGCTSLSTVSIGNSVTSIGQGAFNGCTSLDTIYSYAVIPPNASYNAAFSSGIYSTCKLYVPYGSLDTYRNTEVWKRFDNIEEMIIEPADIVLNDTSKTLHIGEEYQLKAVVYPEDTSIPTVQWQSSDDRIATVSDAGVVKGISAGKAVITASCGNVSTACDVEVFEEVGIEDILLDIDESLNVYNMNGVLVKGNIAKADLKSLPSGYYIVVSRSKSWKVKI